MAKKGLGRGLDALLGDYSATPESGVTELSVHLIDTNAAQPRKRFDEDKLNELAASIRRHGMVQPIIVRRNADRYVIVAGERRYRAARKAGLTTVPVVVREFGDAEVLEVALIENLQRENLNPIEEAAAIRFLMQQHDLTQEEVAERISKSRPAIANTLRLLNLPEPVQQLLRENKLSSGHARALVALKDPARAVTLAQEAVEHGYSVRRMEELSRQKRPKKQAAALKKAPPRDLYNAQEALQARYKTRVRIDGDEAKGRIVIEYYTKEELARLYEQLMGEHKE